MLKKGDTLTFEDNTGKIKTKYTGTYGGYTHYNRKQNAYFHLVSITERISFYTHINGKEHTKVKLWHPENAYMLFLNSSLLVKN